MNLDQFELRLKETQEERTLYVKECMDLRTKIESFQKTLETLKIQNYNLADESSTFKSKQNLLISEINSMKEERKRFIYEFDKVQSEFNQSKITFRKYEQNR
jgi:predicted nuclease with TOPRIM domain